MKCLPMGCEHAFHALGQKNVLGTWLFESADVIGNSIFEREYFCAISHFTTTVAGVNLNSEERNSKHTDVVKQRENFFSELLRA